MAAAIKLLDDMINELEVLVNLSPEVSSGNQGSKSASASKESKPDGDKKAATAPQEKANKKEKAEKASKNAAPSTVASSDPAAPLNINSIDLRVGVIRRVTKHETADKLYCEEIDVGEEEPRPIASGLVPHYTLEEMQDRRIIVICNLKPRNLVGFKSNGMVLCAVATREDGSEKVELLSPPESAKPGDRVVGQGLAGEPLNASQCDKKKAFETVAPLLKLVDGVATWNGVPLVTPTGEFITSPTLKEGILR